MCLGVQDGSQIGMLILRRRVVSVLQRLSNNSWPTTSVANSLHCGKVLCFHESDSLCGGGMMKKDTDAFDPRMEKTRHERKVKRIQREIADLEKFSKQLKPIDELLPLTSAMEARRRENTVPLSPDEVERRALLQKAWARLKLAQHRQEARSLKIALSAQQRALKQLRDESEELYQAAIQVDSDLVPFTRRGPTRTAPIPGYQSPDGDYTDVTKKWA